VLPTDEQQSELNFKKKVLLGVFLSRALTVFFGFVCRVKINIQ
jgi:hypothetical protein